MCVCLCACYGHIYRFSHTVADERVFVTSLDTNGELSVEVATADVLLKFRGGGDPEFSGALLKDEV